MKHDVIGVRGHMRDGEVVHDEVIVKLVDGDDIVVGRGVTEKKAADAADAELKRFRAEQKLLNTPEVVAARAALAEAMRLARQNL